MQRLFFIFTFVLALTAIFPAMAREGNGVPHVDFQQFMDEVLRAELPVLVQFDATWCSNCRAIQPTMQAIASTKAGSLKIVRVDVDEEKGLARNYHVSAVPTLIFFYQGKMVARNDDGLKGEGLHQWINEVEAGIKAQDSL